jgi:agmatinase
MSDTHKLWADLHVPNSQPKDTTFTVMGIPFDGLASARKGAAQAPAYIRNWTHQISPFTEDRTCLTDLSVYDLGDFPINDPATDYDAIAEVIAKLPNIPVILGGDHSIAIPILKAQRQRYANKRLGILWVDAHPDLCDEFNGSRLSHATVLRRGLDYGIQQKDICLVAVRSWEMQEMDLIENGKLNVYPMPMIADLGIEKIAHKVWRHLSKCDAVHISLDIDCLDPAAAPGTGTPEPGGMTMREVLHLLKSLEGLPLVGLDVVEVAPPLDPSESTVFAAIKVIMEFMGVIARSRKQQSK